MLRLGKVGAGRQGLSDGQPNILRLSKNGSLIVDTGVAEYYESMSRGKLFIASSAVTGVAPGTALSTTPPFVLFNPPDSGVIATLVDIECSFQSGVLGAGNIVLAQAVGQRITTFGTDLLPLPAGVGINGRPACRALQAPTLSVTPSMVRSLWYTGAFVTNTTLYFGQARKDVAGMFGILPGGVLCLQEVGGAGATPLVIFSMSWIEVPSIFTL